MKSIWTESTPQTMVFELCVGKGAWAYGATLSVKQGKVEDPLDMLTNGKYFELTDIIGL